MKYLFQGILLVFAFYICRREEKKFKECFEKQIYDKGIHLINPLRGEEAAKKAKVGIFLAKFLPWVILAVLVLSAIKEKMA